MASVPTGAWTGLPSPCCVWKHPSYGGESSSALLALAGLYCPDAVAAIPRSAPLVAVCAAEVGGASDDAVDVVSRFPEDQLEEAVAGGSLGSARGVV